MTAKESNDVAIAIADYGNSLGLPEPRCVVQYMGHELYLSTSCCEEQTERRLFLRQKLSDTASAQQVEELGKRYMDFLQSKSHTIH